MSGTGPREKAGEAGGIAALAQTLGTMTRSCRWDWRYYDEKLRARKFAFDEAELKPYLQLNRIIDAAFDVATRLFGMSFGEQQGIAAWHPDVRVFKVFDPDGRISRCSSATISHASKRSGAWMSALKSHTGWARAQSQSSTMS